MKLTREKTLTGISATVTAVIGCICLNWWMTHDPAADLIAHVPGMDGELEAAAVESVENIDIGEIWESLAGTPSELPGEWVQFRGADSDNIVAQSSNFVDTWRDQGPPILWSLDLGEGHAGAAVKNGRVYLIDYDEEKKADLLRCFSLEDGQEIWQRGYRVKVKRNHGMSRTVPAVTDDFVVTIGPRCHTMCVDAETGDFIWGLDLEKDYGTTTPFWYTGQCPFVDDTTVVLAPAGSNLMIGVGLASGNILWEVPNPNGWEMSHVSVMPMTLNGKRMYVYSAVGGMVAVSAETEDVGTILWETTLWTHSVLAPSPLITEDGRIFLTAGYGAGSMVLKVTDTGTGYEIEQLQEYKPSEGMASEQQTPLHWQGHFFSIQPKDAGGLREQFVCYHPDDCTRLVWSSGETNRFGLGPYIIADDKIYILNDDGLLTMIEASTRRYNQLGQFKVLDGHDAWAPIAVAGTRMLLRDSQRMVCLDLSG